MSRISTDTCCKQFVIKSLKYSDAVTLGSGIFSAVEVNDFMTVERLLQAGVPVDIRDKVTPLLPCMCCIMFISIGLHIYVIFR